MDIATVMDGAEWLGHRRVTLWDGHFECSCGERSDRLYYMADRELYSITGDDFNRFSSWEQHCYNVYEAKIQELTEFEQELKQELTQGQAKEAAVD